MTTDDAQAALEGSCACFTQPYHALQRHRGLGLDAHGAEASLWRCGRCGQWWLNYHYEIEAFTASGRWYLTAVAEEEAAVLVAGQARSLLESAGWYFYGGSYYGGRSGRTSGPLNL